MDVRRPLAQVIAVLLVIVSVVSCLCGGLLTLFAISTSDPLIMPDGAIATQSDTTNTIIITLCLSAVFALALLMVAVAIWYLFGRQDSVGQILPKMVVLGLLIVGLFLVLWGGLVALTAVLTDGMTALGSQLGTIPGFLGSMACLIPGVILIFFSLFVWFFFVRDKMVPGQATTETDPSPAAAYFVFMHSILPQLQGETVDASIQVRTMLTLQKATTIEQAEIITFLYEEKLIIGKTPKISLRGCQLHQIDLSTKYFPAINLAGTNLTEANFYKANLSDAHFNDAILISADCRFADFSRANFQTTNLRRAKFHRANLHHANFQQAELTNANLWQAEFTHTVITDEQLNTTINSA